MVRANAGVSRLSSALLAAAVLSLPVLPALTTTASAQQDSAQMEPGDLLRDFIHYVKIGQYEAAAGMATELLDRGLSDTEFVDLVEQSREFDRFQEAVSRGMRVGMLEEIAASLDRKYTEGKLARVRSPEEVTRYIAMLDTGGLRQRQFARDGLLAAGEYAMPQLMETYLANSNPALKARVQEVMIALGRQAIMPLAVSLPHLDPARQEAVVEVLGQIPYRTSLPYLADLNQKTSVGAVRDATAWAIGQLGGQAGMDVAGLYYSLAEAFYDERSELTSFPDEAQQLLWDYEASIGLIPTPIFTEVYHEAMAMRTTETSLRMNPASRDAVALWIASNYSRELDSPEEYENPAYPSDRRDAEFFGIAAGTATAQVALARALDDRDTPLARRVIAAIERTAGGASLWSGDRRPLLEALRYQNRRVQYEAALALGKAQPTQAFEGSDRVVPLLASAVRDASARFAVVLTGDDREEYERYRSVLEGEGYTVLPPASTGLRELRAAISETPGVDLIVSSLSADRTRGVIDEARTTTKLAVTPVLAIVSPDEVEYLSRLYKGDQMIAVRRAGIDQSMFVRATDDLLIAASGGPITEEEAGDYADRSLAVLRDLAVSRNSVLDVNDAAAPLIAVLEDARGVLMISVGEVLSYVDQPRAQSALMDKALDVSGGEQTAMLRLTEASGKRFGRMIDDRQVRRLTELARSSDFDLATNAVAVIGAMNLPNEDLLPLMLEGAASTREVRVGRP